MLWGWRVVIHHLDWEHVFKFKGNSQWNFKVWDEVQTYKKFFWILNPELSKTDEDLIKSKNDEVDIIW